MNLPKKEQIVETAKKTAQSHFTHIALVSAVVGIVGAKINHTFFHHHGQKNAVVEKKKIEKKTTVSQKLAELEVYEKKIAGLKKQYGTMEKLPKEAVQQLKPWELWDVLQGTPLYHNMHQKIEDSMKNSEDVETYDLDTTEVNQWFASIGKKRKVISAKEFEEGVAKTVYKLDKHVNRGNSVAYRGERQVEDNAPFGIIWHLTDYPDTPVNNSVPGVINTTARGGSAPHFVITKMGEIILTLPVNTLSCTATLDNFAERNKPVKTHQRQQDRFADHFLNIELVGDAAETNGVPDGYLTKPQKEALFDLIEAVQQRYGFSSENILGHGAVNNIELGRYVFPNEIKKKTAAQIRTLCNKKHRGTVKGWNARMEVNYPYTSRALLEKGRTECASGAIHHLYTSSHPYHYEGGPEESALLQEEYQQRATPQRLAKNAKPL